jgi:hypothetical protein
MPVTPGRIYGDDEEVLGFERRLQFSAKFAAMIGEGSKRPRYNVE